MATRTTRTGLVLLCLLAAGHPARGQFTEGWRRLESGNFVLAGNARESDLRRVAENLEEFRAAFLTLVPSYRETHETETTVVVFRDDEAFRPFKPEDDVSGYFTAGPYRNYIALTGERDMEQAIYHEYVHQLTREARHWPRWLREGTAEFYGTIGVDPGGGSVSLGRPIPSHVFWLRQAFMPLGEFLDPETRYDTVERTTTLYAQSWALVHFMRFGRPELARRIEPFLEAMAASGNDVHASVQAAFGTGLDTLESELRRYLGRGAFPTGEMTLDERLEDIELPDSVEIPEAEASFYLGDLLLHLGIFGEAEFFFGRSVELAGEFEPALTGLYVLNDRLGNDQEAMEFLERALRAPGAGYLPHLFMAEERLEAGPFADVAGEAEGHLRHVIRENPGLPEGHFWLGRVLMRRAESVEEAVEALETAVDLRGDPLMRLIWSRALWMSGNSRAALEVLAELSETDLDPVVREQAGQFLEELRWLESAGAAAPEDGTASPVGGIPSLQVPDGMRQVEGHILYIGCAEGLQLVIASDPERVRLIGAGMEGVRLISYSPAVQGRVPCGAMDPALPVRVIYRPTTDSPGVDGEPVRVDFLP